MRTASPSRGGGHVLMFVAFARSSLLGARSSPLVAAGCGVVRAGCAAVFCAVCSPAVLLHFNFR